MTDIARPPHSKKFAQFSDEWAESCDNAFKRAMAQTVPQTFTLPWPISVNDMYRSISRGGKATCSILSKRARLWYEAAGAELNIQKPIPVKGPVRLSLVFGPPTKRLFDLDGKLKATFDLLVRHKVIQDDNWMYVPQFDVGIDWNFVGVRITVTPIGGAE
jgi:Holliday junction resolvase RusA-like endonuclease